MQKGKGLQTELTKPPREEEDQVLFYHNSTKDPLLDDLNFFQERKDFLSR
jgi:hypothetical protein